MFISKQFRGKLGRKTLIKKSTQQALTCHLTGVKQVVSILIYVTVHLLLDQRAQKNPPYRRESPVVVVLTQVEMYH